MHSFSIFHSFKLSCFIDLFNQIINSVQKYYIIFWLYVYLFFHFILKLINYIYTHIERNVYRVQAKLFRLGNNACIFLPRHTKLAKKFSGDFVRLKKIEVWLKIDLYYLSCAPLYTMEQIIQLTILYLQFETLSKVIDLNLCIKNLYPNSK